MEIWCDSADIPKVRGYHALGLLQGITTNPALLSAYPQPLSVLDQLSELQLPLAVQLTAATLEKCLEQARFLKQRYPHCIIKIPMTEPHFPLMQQLRDRMPFMATCIYTASQTLLAAKLGATYVAPYVDRMQKAHMDVFSELAQMQSILLHGKYRTKILAASISTVATLVRMASEGIDAVTLKPELFDMWISTDQHSQSAVMQFQQKIIQSQHSLDDFYKTSSTLP